MKKKFLSILLSLAMCLSLLPTAVLATGEGGTTVDKWDGTVASGFAGGNGTKNNPYLIATGAQLAYLGQSTGTNGYYDGKYFKLTADIDLDNKLWTPIEKLEGSFDGGGHTISGLNVNSSDSPCGLFRKVDADSTDIEFKNLTVSGSVSSSGDEVGGVIGKCFGWGHTATVSNCHFIGDVTSTDTTNPGGVGGVIGYCTANKYGGKSGKITVEGCTHSGGMVTGANYNVGGVIGCCVFDGGSSTTVTGCANSGAVMGQERVGGVIGYFATVDGRSGTVENCVNTGAVSGQSNVGGVVGDCDPNSNGVAITVTACCNTGTVSRAAGDDDTTYENFGGVIGNRNSDDDGTLTVSGCYYRNDCAGDDVAFDDAAVDGISARDDMADCDSAFYAEWDFYSKWEKGDNGPTLRTSAPDPSETAMVRNEAELLAAVKLNAEIIKMTKDITVSQTVTIGDSKTITLDLNGHTLKNTTDNEGNNDVLVVRNASLTLTDSSANGTGKVETVSGMSAVHVTAGSGESSTLTMTGGTLVGTETEEGATVGGALTIENINGDGAVFNAHGGTVSGIVKSNAGTIGGADDATGATKFTAAVENHDGTISYGVFQGTVANNGTIEGGVFNGTVENNDTIKGGTFNDTVTNNRGKTISGGTFNDEVTNNGSITDGTFNDEVTNNGSITGGTFNDAVTNNSTITGGTFYGDVTLAAESKIDGGVFYSNVNCDEGDSAYITGGTFYGAIDDGVKFENPTGSTPTSVTRYLVNFFEKQEDIGEADKVLETIIVVGDSTTLAEPTSDITIKMNGSTYVCGSWYYTNGTATKLFAFDSTKVSAAADSRVLNLFPTDQSILYKVITLEIPFTIKVEQGGTATPPSETFELEFEEKSDAVNLSTVYKAEGMNNKTDGAKAYNFALKFTGISSDLNTVLSGLTVRQKNNGIANWTYDDTVWHIELNGSFDDIGAFVPQSGGGASGNADSSTTTYDPLDYLQFSKVVSDELAPASAMIFTNIYTKNGETTPSGDSVTRYTITATAGEGGSISPTGRVRVTRGSDKTFTIAPAKGYRVSDVLVDGKSVGPRTSYTFKTVKTNHTIEAVFEAASNIPGGLNSTDHVAFVQGFADGLVRPNANITRAQTAVMLYRLLTPERRAAIETDSHPFTDMTAADWYSHEVATMTNGGYISGYSDGTFRGNDPITRAQFVAILVRFLGLRDVTCDFTDVPASHWAYQYIATAVDAGWISGFADGTFRPDQSITRAQVMTIINRALDRGVSAESALVSGWKNFPDNPATAWHYYEVIEATNGHDYTGHRPSENWTALK